MSLPLGLPTGFPAHTLPEPYLAEDVEDTIGGKEVSHIHASILHPDPLEGSRQSSATGGRRQTLKSGVQYQQRGFWVHRHPPVVPSLA